MVEPSQSSTDGSSQALDTGVAIETVFVTSNDTGASTVVNEYTTVAASQQGSTTATSLETTIDSSFDTATATATSITTSVNTEYYTTIVTTYVTTYADGQVSTVTQTLTDEVMTTHQVGSALAVSATTSSVETNDTAALASTIPSGTPADTIVTEYVTTYADGTVATVTEVRNVTATSEPVILTSVEVGSGVYTSLAGTVTENVNETASAFATMTTDVPLTTTLPPNPVNSAQGSKNDTAAGVVRTPVPPSVITSMGATSTTYLGANCEAPYTPGQVVNPTIGFDVTIYVTECCSNVCLRQTETSQPEIPVVTVTKTETESCDQDECVVTTTEPCKFCTFTTSLVTQTTVIEESTVIIYSPCPTIAVPSSTPEMVTTTVSNSVVQTMPKGGYEPLTRTVTYAEECSGACPAVEATGSPAPSTANPSAPHQVVCSGIACTTNGPPPPVCSQGECVTTVYPTVMCSEEVCHSVPPSSSPVSSNSEVVVTVPANKTIPLQGVTIVPNVVTITKSHGTVSCAEGSGCTTNGPSPVVCVQEQCTTIEYPTVSCQSNECTTQPMPEVTIVPTETANFANQTVAVTSMTAVTVPVVATTLSSHGTVSCTESGSCTTQGPPPVLCVQEQCTTVEYPTVNCVSNECKTTPVPEITMPANPSAGAGENQQVVYVTTEYKTEASTQSHGTVTCSESCQTQGPPPVVCVDNQQCTTIAYPTVSCSEEICHTVPAPVVTPTVTQEVTLTKPIPGTVFHPVESGQSVAPPANSLSTPALSSVPTAVTMTTQSHGSVVCSGTSCTTEGPRPVICGGPWCTTVEYPIVTCEQSCSTVSSIAEITFSPSVVVTSGPKGQPTSMVCVGTECLGQPHVPVPPVTTEQQPPTLQTSAPPPEQAPASSSEVAQGAGVRLSLPLSLTTQLLGLVFGALLL